MMHWAYDIDPKLSINIFYFFSDAAAQLEHLSRVQLFQEGALPHVHWQQTAGAYSIRNVKLVNILV